MNKGNLLVSASGKGHSAITKWWIVNVVGAVGCAAICLAVAFYLENDYRTQAKAVSKIYNAGNRGAYGDYVASVTGIKDMEKERLAELKKDKELKRNVLIGVGFVTVALCLVMGGLITSRISKTAVGVYETGVEGTSVTPKFPLAFMLYCSMSSLQLVDFQLAYSEISSVDIVDGNTVVINAGSVKHKIYAMNAKRIRDTIVSRKAAV